MDSNTVLIFLSGLVVLSYAFDVFARRTRVPSVLLLLGTGIAARQIGDLVGWGLPAAGALLPLLGAVGIILIVLDGALDLELRRERMGAIVKPFLTALAVLIVSTILIAWLFIMLLGVDPRTALLNAIPLAVVSSSIVLPSVASLAPALREFMIYDATFSDILGILFFNAVLQEDSFTFGSLARAGTQLVVMLVVSAVCSVLLMWLLGRLRHRVKFFLLIAALTLVYAAGEMLHLSSLLLVLVFGLLFNNVERVIPARIRERLQLPPLGEEVRLLAQLTAESAFVIRTFFFVLFGWTLHLAGLVDVRTIGIGATIIAMIYGVRMLTMRLANVRPMRPAVMIAPRGLVTILLYYSIPASLMLAQLGEGILTMVVIATGLGMMWGLIARDRTPQNA